jgi:hypothetical protein
MLESGLAEEQTTSFTHNLLAAASLVPVRTRGVRKLGFAGTGRFPRVISTRNRVCPTRHGDLGRESP